MFLGNCNVSIGGKFLQSTYPVFSCDWILPASCATNIFLKYKSERKRSCKATNYILQKFRRINIVISLRKESAQAFTALILQRRMKGNACSCWWNSEDTEAKSFIKLDKLPEICRIPLGLTWVFSSGDVKEVSRTAFMLTSGALFLKITL